MQKRNLTLWDYARGKDENSQAAYDKLKRKSWLNKKRKAVLDAVVAAGDDGLTPHEYTEQIGDVKEAVYKHRPRFTELYKAGYIQRIHKREVAGFKEWVYKKG